MFWISLLVAASAAAADQLFKYLVVQNIGMSETKSFIPGVLSLTQVRNSGAAWNFMEGKTWFLIGVPVALITAALIFMYKYRHASGLVLISAALVTGGGLGNLIDRIRLHEVVDYLRLELFDFPVFNFADMCVVVGAFAFWLSMTFLDKSENKDSKDKESKKEDGESDGGGTAPAV